MHNLANLSFALSQPQRVIFNPLVSGRTYTVTFRTDLNPTTWTPLPGTTQSDNDAECTVTDLDATGTDVLRGQDHQAVGCVRHRPPES